jgi:hypothetical protein
MHISAKVRPMVSSPSAPFRRFPFLFGLTFFLSLLFAAQADTGILQWKGSKADIWGARSVAVDSNGNVFLLGNTAGYDSITLVKFRGDTGAVLWTKIYTPSTISASGGSMAVDTQGNVVVTGTYDTDPGVYGDRIFTAKFSGVDGALMWLRTYAGPGTMDRGEFCTLDAAGNAIVAGHSQVTSSFQEIYVAKYAAANGDVIWEKRFSGAGTQTCEVRGLVGDSLGNVFITGFAAKTGAAGRSTLVKFAAADGTLLWQENPPSLPGSSAPYCLTLDPAGNPIVGGYVSVSSKKEGFIAKYASNDGAEIWRWQRQVLQNPATEVRNVFCDAAGQIFGTGNTGLGDLLTSKADLLAVKLNSDGTLAWERSYNGPGNHQDEGKDIALDGSGDMFVLGVIRGSGTGTDIYLAKYAGATGATLWESTHNGTASTSGDHMHGTNALAFTPDGAIVMAGSFQHTASQTMEAYKYRTTPQTIQTLAPTLVNARSAMLRAQVLPGTETVSVRFYLNSNLVAGVDVPPGNVPVIAEASTTLLTANTTYTLTSELLTSLGNIPGLAVTFKTPPQGLSAWKTEHYGATTVADDADTDFDSSNTLVEYARRLNPTVPNPTATPAPQRYTYADGERLRVFVERDPLRTEVKQFVEAASSLSGPWSVLASHVGGGQFSGPGYVGGDGIGITVRVVEIRDTVPMSTSTQRFLRVRVEKNP